MCVCVCEGRDGMGWSGDNMHWLGARYSICAYVRMYAGNIIALPEGGASQVGGGGWVMLRFV